MPLFAEEALYAFLISSVRDQTFPAMRLLAAVLRPRSGVTNGRPPKTAESERKIRI